MRKILLALLISTSCAGAQYRAFIAMNVNSCSYCNKITPLFMNGTLRDATFLFSEEDVTHEQAAAFVQTIMGKPCKILVDEKFFNEVSSGITLFKMPHVVIADSMRHIVFKKPIDSAGYYSDVLHALLNNGPYTLTKLSHPRLTRIAGQKSISKCGSSIAVGSWQQRDRIYLYNITTRKLDSLAFSDKMIRELLRLGGSACTDPAKVRTAWDRAGMGNDIIEFSATTTADSSRIYGMISMYYPVDVDSLKPGPDGFPDISWSPFVFSYEPRLKKLTVSPFKYYETDSIGRASIHDGFGLDYDYRQQINDSTWLFGANKLRDTVPADARGEKMYYYFRKYPSEQRLRYAGRQILFAYDSLVTFSGEQMNKPNYRYQTKLIYPYLVYMGSPSIMNHETGAIFNVSGISNKISWIYDAALSDHTIRLLVKEDKYFVLYTLERSDNHVLHRKEIAPTDAKSNVVLDGENIFYMNKAGEVIQWKVND